MQNKVRLLSVAGIDAALVKKAAIHNVVLDCIPFIDIKKLDTALQQQEVAVYSSQQATVIFTSVHAVEIVVSLLPQQLAMPPWKIYCIGGATYTLLTNYWTTESIVFTAMNAGDLARKMVDDKVQNPVFFCGNLRRDDLPAILQSAMVDVQEVVVYDTIQTPVKISVEYDGIMFYSSSAVHSFFSCNSIRAFTILFAIGNTTATAIKEYCGNQIIISDFPAKGQIVEKAIAHFVA